MLLISWMIRIFDLATNVKSLYLVLGIHALKILFIIHAIGPVQELFQNSEFWIRSQADSETIERLQSNAGEILARIQHESDFQKSYFRCSRQENDCILQNAHNEPKCVDTMVNTSTKLVAILPAHPEGDPAPTISQPILLTYSDNTTVKLKSWRTFLHSAAIGLIFWPLIVELRHYLYTPMRWRRCELFWFYKNGQKFLKITPNDLLTLEMALTEPPRNT